MLRLCLGIVVGKQITVNRLGETAGVSGLVLAKRSTSQGTAAVTVWNIRREL
jgi:hypothetical protein